MSDSRKKGRQPRDGGKPFGGAKLRDAAKPPAAGKPGAATLRSLVVHFRAQGDPSAEQTEALRSLLKRFPRKAAVKRELPGAIKVEVAADAEAELRRSIDELKEWDVGNEGLASMPDKPVPKE